jgi:hypothetical protein
MRKLILFLGLLAIIFSLGGFVSVVATRCDLGRVLLVNTLKIDQEGLRLFGDSSKPISLWDGSIPPGGVEEIILVKRLGSNLILEGTNAASGRPFSELSYYVSSMTSYGTYIFLIEPDGVRPFVHESDNPRHDGSTTLQYETLRVLFRELLNDIRCANDDLWRWSMR